MVELDDARWEDWLANAKRRNLTMSELLATVLEEIMVCDLLPEILGETDEGARQ